MPRPAQKLSYLVVLRTPGAVRPFTGAMLARLSYGTISLSMILTVQDATGSLGSAGAALGLYGAPALLMPLKSRAVDRYGPRRVLPRLALAYSGCLALMAALAVTGVFIPTPYLVLAGAAGLLAPPVGPVMRHRWTELCPTLVHRQKAYALDASAEETVFVIGPLIVGALGAVAQPVAGLALSAVLALAGVLQLVRGTPQNQRPATQAASGQDAMGLLANPAMRWILLAMMTVGAALSLVEVEIVAITDETGHPATSGYLLAALSIGSVAGGLLWGRRHHLRSHTTHLVGLMLALAAAVTLASTVTTSVPALGVVVLVIGFFVAPIFIVAYLSADQSVAGEMRTEATTWVAAASNLGAALGASLSGQLVGRITATAAVLATGTSLAIVAVILGAITATQRLRIPDQPRIN